MEKKRKPYFKFRFKYFPFTNINSFFYTASSKYFFLTKTDILKNHSDFSTPLIFSTGIPFSSADLAIFTKFSFLFKNYRAFFLHIKCFFNANALENWLFDYSGERQRKKFNLSSLMANDKKCVIILFGCRLTIVYVSLQGC